MISVIVPVYNVEKYIRNCLDSIINQTYKDLEIILVDDGSTDNSGAICDEYAQKDSRIKVIHKQNGGLSSARNAGLDNATGKYVGFIDSDDFIELDMYEKLLNTLQVTQTDVCMCGCKIVSEQGAILFKNNLPIKIYKIDDILKDVILPLETSAWNKLYKREIIGNARFPEGKIHGEDLIFTLEYLTSEMTFSAIEDYSYYYVKHPSSITTSKFSIKSFDEVYCKDQAYNLVAEKFPHYKENALKWCFRARMNIIRKLLGSVQIEEYNAEYENYKTWVIKNYKLVKCRLSLKERLEFNLLKISKGIYKVVAKRRFYKK